MTEKEIRKNVYKKFGDVDFELIQFNRACDPVVYKCLNCGKIFERKRLQTIYSNDRTRFCSCLPLKENPPLKLPLTEAQKRLDDVFGGEYEIIQNKYNGWSKKGLIKHTICGKIFSCQPRELLHNSHCPCVTISSKGEDKIEKVLIKYRIKYEKQKRLEDMKKAPFDFYLPDYNLLIEFQGRQHFEPVEKFGGQKQFVIQQNIDKRKKELAEKEGLNLLYISYKQMSLIEDILVPRLSLTGVESSDSKYQLPQNED